MQCGGDVIQVNSLGSVATCMLATPDNSLLAFQKVVGTWLSPSIPLLESTLINSHVVSLSCKYVILLLQMNHVLVLVLH